MTDFEEYIRQGEPQEREKGLAWQTAIGLQAVDGLTTSDYLIQTARAHIEGDITIEEVKKLVDNYYQSKPTVQNDEVRTEEADKVSARITEILSEKSFNFSPVEYITIHKRLFDGIYNFAGAIRDYNITKKEWVLRGKTVIYGNASNLKETLEYDFSQEKNFSYRGIGLQETVAHLAKFVAYLWQIHPFGEGNTRTTALFTIKYLRTLGFDVNNDTFAAHSWYFRNALVRANYTDVKQGIFTTTEYLELFFRNLLMDEANELKNRNLLIADQTESQSAKTDSEQAPKCKISTLNCTLEEKAVMLFVKDNPRATQKEIAAHIGKSERTVKKITVDLANKGLLERKNGRRNGFWEVKEQINI